MKDIRVVLGVLGAFVAATAWVAYANHPTAKNLRRAIIDTVEI